MDKQIFKNTSRNARCLLSDDGVFVTLAGYSDFKKMMQYRLDKETALVLVSAVTLAKPGSASDPCVVSVEHMRKVSKDERAALLISMASEWKSVLTAPDDLCKREYQSASDPAYWTPESMQKVRRLQSEPASPGPVKPAGGGREVRGLLSRRSLECPRNPAPTAQAFDGREAARAAHRGDSRALVEC